LSIREESPGLKLLEEAFVLKQVDRSNSLSMSPRESVSLDRLKHTDSLETTQKHSIADGEDNRIGTGLGVINYSEHYHSTRTTQPNDI
jgi:hypothetical protein